MKLGLIVKRCRCRRTFTMDEWEALEHVGVQHDDEFDLELRNCRCGSTISLRKSARLFRRAGGPE